MNLVCDHFLLLNHLSIHFNHGDLEQRLRLVDYKERCLLSDLVSCFHILLICYTLWPHARYSDSLTKNLLLICLEVVSEDQLVVSELYSLEQVVSRIHESGHLTGWFKVTGNLDLCVNVWIRLENKFDCDALVSRFDHFLYDKF